MKNYYYYYYYRSLPNLPSIYKPTFIFPACNCGNLEEERGNIGRITMI